MKVAMILALLFSSALFASDSFTDLVTSEESADESERFTKTLEKVSQLQAQLVPESMRELSRIELSAVLATEKAQELLAQNYETAARKKIVRALIQWSLPRESRGSVPMALEMGDFLVSLLKEGKYYDLHEEVALELNHLAALFGATLSPLHTEVQKIRAVPAVQKSLEIFTLLSATPAQMKQLSTGINYGQYNESNRERFALIEQAMVRLAQSLALAQLESHAALPLQESLTPFHQGVVLNSFGNAGRFEWIYKATLKITDKARGLLTWSDPVTGGVLFAPKGEMMAPVTESHFALRKVSFTHSIMSNTYERELRLAEALKGVNYRHSLKR